MIPMVDCQHATLRFLAQGFRVACDECGQEWVAKRAGASRDDDLDNGLRRTCTTPLANIAGRLEFRPRARHTS